MQHRQQLLARYRDELEHVDEIDIRDPEEVERSTEKWNQQTLARVGEADARQLAEVIAALRRLDEGTYGRCATCEQPIGSQRLEALPTARLCIECAVEPRSTQPVREHHTA